MKFISSDRIYSATLSTGLFLQIVSAGGAQADVMYISQAQDPNAFVAPDATSTTATARMRPLQGSIEQTGQSPNGFIRGTALERSDLPLKGTAQNDNWTGGSLSARRGDTRPDAFQANASQQSFSLNAATDPDSTDQELQIEWDSWRNRLMQTIQSGTLAKINVHNDIHFVWDAHSQMMLSRYPNGISAWYAYEVLPTRQIVNMRLTQSSGYPSYDQAVLQSIWELQGQSLLTYPAGSRRQIVFQEGSVGTSAVTQFQNFKFGDVERQHY